MAMPFQALCLEAKVRYTKAIITVHAQSLHTWLSPGPGLTPSVPKQWKLDVHAEK